ncbi:Putative dyhydroflavanol-4-reductase [Minicystis rosea]|nr:Putative dyhydroflavanol-4-reductase [Minicystis rosea]
MRVFVTGATGFIGSAVVRELVQAGHQVTGLVRSEEGEKQLARAGASALRGTIEDLDSLRRGAEGADGVVHTAFFHSFGHASLGIRLRVMFGGGPAGMFRRFMAAAVEVDRRAIEALGTSLRGAERSLVVPFGTLAMAPGRVAVETDAPDPNSVNALRGASEEVALALASRGVKVSVIRLPPAVHDEHKLGLVSLLIQTARKKKVSAYVGLGDHRWGAVHRLDAARLFRLALEKREDRARYHGVAEGHLRLRDVAEAIGQHLGVPVRAMSPEEAPKHFAWLAPAASADNPCSSEATQERLGWRPTHPQLMADIAASLQVAQPVASKRVEPQGSNG